MKIGRLEWRSYRIPFRRAFATSGATQTVRAGFIVRIEAEPGPYGLGEIAPLAGDDVSRIIVSLLADLGRRVAGLETETIAEATADLDAPDPIAAAVRCGLDIAACDLLGKAIGAPVVQVLGGLRRRLVPVNATISAAAPDLAAQSARLAVQNGFTCVKLKVGMMDSLKAECDLVAAVRDAIGAGTLLRLDANQAWDPDTAVAAIRALEHFGLEFVEQPVAARDIEGLAAVRRAVNTPIAADEPVTSLEAARQLIAARAADLLVIKPMVVGGLRAARAIIELAAAAGVESVVTTTIDSGVGIAAALHLAASFNGTRACGLATAELLESDLTSSTPPALAGGMSCPVTAGLGVEIDEAQSAPYLDRR